MKISKSPRLFFVCVGILLTVVLALGFFQQCHGTPIPPTHAPKPTSTASYSSAPVPISITPSRRPPTSTTHAITILLDDFSPQPYQEESVYFFNRLEGDRGAVNSSILDWGNGQATTTISSGNSWGGVWMSLNHPIREGLPINFSAILPAQILPPYQSQVTGITAVIVDGTPGRTFKLELKDRGELHWKKEIVLNGGRQIVSSDLPALGNINELLWVLDHASAGDYVVLESVSLTATTQITDVAESAFVWSYGMLLNDWNPDTGLVRDKSRDPSGEFDAIQSTGSLAAATAVAEQLGVISHSSAVQIVTKISDTLLINLPRYHGLWPHWVQESTSGELTIVYGTEWSSIDTSIAALALLEAQTVLGLDTFGVEQMLRDIDWDDLPTSNGIAHGYWYDGTLIPSSWDVFGGESWLVALVYAASTHQVPPIKYSTPSTANGSGFIDELSWLFIPPPSSLDRWGTDWVTYRETATDAQIVYYCDQYPSSCFCQLGLFGLSAGEVPDASAVAKGNIYQAFGIGGQFSSANDGASLLGAPVVVPHYSAIIASLRPQEAIDMWRWLIEQGLFSPLNNVESLVFSTGESCDTSQMEWNHLKGSWNLSLQTLGWGCYLAERQGQTPALWQATASNIFIQEGYDLIASANPRSIPGKIEAEDYDIGGEGVAYYDTTSGNEGGVYRNDDVDIQGTTDIGNGHNVGWIEEGEWLAYTVDVTSAGLYDIQVRVAPAMDTTISETLPVIETVSWTVPLTRVVHVEFDGVDVSGPMTFVATGGWQNWTSVFARRVPLTEGQHVMRIAMDSDGLNVNWISFAESRPLDKPPAETIDWLIAQMTTAEKIDQLYGSDWMDTCPGRKAHPFYARAQFSHLWWNSDLSILNSEGQTINFLRPSVVLLEKPICFRMATEGALSLVFDRV